MESLKFSFTNIVPSLNKYGKKSVTEYSLTYIYKSYDETIKLIEFIFTNRTMKLLN